MSIWEQSAGLQRADLGAGDMAELDGAMSLIFWQLVKMPLVV